MHRRSDPRVAALGAALVLVGLALVTVISHRVGLWPGAAALVGGALLCLPGLGLLIVGLTGYHRDDDGT